MALIRCDFFSEALGLWTSMDVILPQGPQISRDGSQALVNPSSSDFAGHPTLYLLHGRSDDHTVWQRWTAIERYVRPTGLAVVMPNVHRSFYSDMQQGGRYFEFVNDELPQVARELFRLSARREDNFVAGLSMGGYGALKLAMLEPDKFAAAAALSPATDIRQRYQDGTALDRAEYLRIFGDVAQLTAPDDLFALAREFAAHEGVKPRLYQCCGTSDFLYEQNVRFQRHVQELGVELTYEEHSGFGHTWDYWDRQIRHVIEWMGFAPGV